MKETNEIKNTRAEKKSILQKTIAQYFPHEEKSHSTPMSRASIWNY